MADYGDYLHERERENLLKTWGPKLEDISDKSLTKENVQWLIAKNKKAEHELSLVKATIRNLIDMSK